jgi:hypothetical protein
MEHGVIKDAVDSNRGADSQGKRQDCGEREAEVAENLPECEPEILEQYMHQRLLEEEDLRVGQLLRLRSLQAVRKI